MDTNELVVARESIEVTAIDPSEVLRYVGYGAQEMSEEFGLRLDSAIARCFELAAPRMALRSFELAGETSAGSAGGAETSAGPAGGAETGAGPAGGAETGAGPAASSAAHAAVRLDKSQLVLSGKDITSHLAGATQVVLMATTIGAQIDQELRRLSFGSSVAHLLFDAAATTLVERAADAAEARVRDWAASKGQFTSWRFSPGYGDLPLETQTLLLASLDATRQLGITLTDSLLMAPTKSVTAIIGIHPVPQIGMASSCSICSLFDFCTQRLQGRTCRG